MPQYTFDDKATFVHLWLGAIKRQAITWANVDSGIYLHIASLGHKEL